MVNTIMNFTVDDISFNDKVIDKQTGDDDDDMIMKTLMNGPEAGQPDRS